MHIVYAERLGGPNSPPQNSILDVDAPPVLLGTANPDRVKSGVPKSGASLYTGLTGGIPTSSNKSTMLAVIPTLTAASTTADLVITRVTDDAEQRRRDCITQGHFRECPTFDVTIPGVTFRRVPDDDLSHRREQPEDAREQDPEQRR